MIDIVARVKQGSAFGCRWDAAALTVAAWITDNPCDPLVATVHGWDGDRETEVYSQSGPCYCSACEDIWRHGHEVETGRYPPDFGCSRTTHDAYKFVSDFIIALMADRTDLALQLKKDKIEKLRKEIEALQAEIGPKED